ncbi:MAG: hypothetical protein Q8O12_00115 [Candidatus Omnitrophota bacterium]|nr:hypothetical protein [Candidatus Omnitrophota bacterium]
MFNYLRIILLILFISSEADLAPVFSATVGTVEAKKSSWYAIVRTENKGKKLYVKGDIFSSNKNPSKSFRIKSIEKDTILLEDANSKTSVMLKPGDSIPIEDSGMIFEKTVEADALEYNYNKPSQRFTKSETEDFTVKSFEKRKIVLEKDSEKSRDPKKLSEKEKEIFSAPKQGSLDKKIILAELFDNLASEKIGQDVWAFRRKNSEPAIDNAGEALMSAIKGVEPGYRFGEGPSLKFNTDLGTVVVDRKGFLIQDITLANAGEKFGIMKGDVIRSINGYQVNSLLGIYRVYNDVSSGKNTKFLSIELVRAGKVKTLVYKIR